MSKRVLLLALLAACGPRQAPEPGAQMANQRTMVVPLALEPPPVYALIGYRDRLELTSQQVTSLDSIAESVRRQNAILRDSLEERAITSSRAPGVLQVTPEDRPLLDRIRENNRAALAQVESVLNADQKTEVCELYELDGTDRRDRARREANRRGPRTRRGTAADSSMIIRGFSVWPWCRTTGTARDSTRTDRR